MTASTRFTNRRLARFASSITRLFVLTVITTLCAAAGNAQAARTGTINTIKLNSSVLGEERVILVRTPVGYETNKESYPVLYMTDGDAHIGHTSATIEFLTRNGRMPDLIVVGITNTDRTRDLTPVKATQKNANGELQFPTSGGADKFLKFIETELIPRIESSYRVKPYRILAGHSLGGLFAIHALISRPNVFNSYVAVSPSLQWENAEALKRAEQFFKTQKELNSTLFVSLGNEGGPIGESFDKFKELLGTVQIKDFAWQAEKMTDEDHGSVVLRSHYFGLRKVYDGWLMPRDPNTGAVVGGLKAADEHYAKLSHRFGYSIQTPEVLINLIGYQELGAGEAEKAIATFKINVERYPGSANVYDSLAEAYERNGKIELAQPLYEKAQALGKQNNDPNTAIYVANYQRASEKMKEAQARKNQQ
jgi:predicted alpha/beta superfamily hydrolase